MRVPRWVLASVLVAVPALTSAPPAAANQLLETVTVDTSSTTLTAGTVQLNAGTQYRLVVSGTFTLANGFGQSYTEDPLYCYGDSGFDTPQCTAPTYMADFYVGVGTHLAHVDAFQTVGGGGSPPAYSSSHSYTVDFYPPVSGVLSAGGDLAYTQCKSGPTPCSTQVSGTVTIEIYGAGTSTPPPATNGWVIGGPIELRSWPTFCRFQRSPPPARDTAVAAAATACVLTDLLDAQAESQLREDLRYLVEAAAIWCTVGSFSRNTGELDALGVLLIRARCEAAVKQAVAIYNLLPHRYAPAPDVPSIARTTAGRCPRLLTAAQCKLVSNYQTVVSYTTSVTGYLVDSANRIAAAVKANDPLSAFFQEAFAKINEGVLANDLAVERADGRALAKLLAAHGGTAASVRQVKTGLSRLPSSVLSGPDRALLLAQLSPVSGTLGPGSLGTPLPGSAFASAYQSISLRDLASLVNAFVRLGHFSVGAGQTLVTDLAKALTACSNPTQRIAAMNQFVADALAHAGSDGAFLKSGARPLLAATVPAAACQ